MPPPSEGPARAARYLAPAAFLAAVTVAVLLVHSGLRGGSTATTATTRAATHPATTTRPRTKAPRTVKRYTTVQSGDTFGSIAAREGISVQRLEQLNPGVSSNALRVGQKLRVK